MAFWRAYYHLVWATKNRQPLISSELESTLHHYMIGKAQSLGGIVHAIGGVEDHVHLVASIPPKLAAAEFVQEIKGGSAHYANHELGVADKAFAWQRGYGLLTFGGKQLEITVAYVAGQKTHHSQGTIIAGLEQTDDEDERAVRGEA